LGLKLADLTRKQRDQGRTIGGSKAIGKKVELQVGSAVWKDWPVKVMDQSQALSAYLDNPDGVLGIDFLQEFSSAVFDMTGGTITLSRVPGQSKKKLSGNLKNFNFSTKSGRYILNGIPLEQISGDSVELCTRDQSYRVRINFQETVLVSNGQPVDGQNREVLQKWAQTIPLVSEILKQQNVHGTLKPVIYTLISPKNANDVHLREQLTLLWSADPAEKENIGQTGFGPPMHLAGQLADVQYRELGNSVDHSVRKIMLQILHIQSDGPWMTLGALLIASKSSGEYEFYFVPRSLLDQIVIRKTTDESR
jgi:hypothetical protein